VNADRRRTTSGDGRPPGPDAPDAVSHRWDRRTRQVVVRLVLLAAAYVAWGALAVVLVSLPLYSSEGVSLVEGRAARVTHSTSTVYQMDPGPVRIILALLGGALVVSTASLLWRVARRTTRVGVTGMAASASAGAVALLGMLTVGPFILPLAVLLTVLALPIAPDRRPHPPAHGTVPPGWYGDPVDRASWRYWDGASWTDHTAPTGSPR